MPLAASALLCALVLGLLAGCGGDDAPTEETLGGPTATTLTAQQVRTRQQRVLDQRAQAVRTRDLALFLKRVDRRDTALVARQKRYFRNVSRLPLRTFRYEVLDEQWPGLDPDPAWGAGASVPRVRLSVQLDGFDEVPVQRTVGFAFALRDGRPWIVADSTRSGEPLLEGDASPWDLTSITSRQERGVLGLFDRGTRDDAATVTRAVRDGIAEVSRAVPYRWDEDVVVYSFSDSGVLSSFTDVPGGALDHLGALTFPVYADSERHVAATRMLLMPTSVAAGQPFLGRISRHELSHIAVGRHDDGSPTWLSEGLAEYVGARPLGQDQRIIPTQAVDRARQPQRGMPSSQSFNGPDQEWNYALSWMACDWIADTRGEKALWQLVEQMHDGGRGTEDQDQDMVLESVLGLGSQELAQRAAARIRSIYG